ncbi:Transcription factor [Umbelopsis sp. WA50703]
MATRSKQKQDEQQPAPNGLQPNSRSNRRNSPPPFAQHSSSSSKFDLEPNPFEQSFTFDGKSQQQPSHGYRKNNVLPPAATIDTPTDGNPTAASSNALWDSLRTGELSPSMITAPRASSQAAMVQSQMGPGLAAAGVGNNHLMNQSSMANYANAYQNNQSVQPNNLYVLSAAQQEVMQRGGNLGQQGMTTVKQESDEQHGMGQSRMDLSPPLRQRTTTSPESSADDTHRRRSRNRRSSSARRTDTDDSEKRKNFLERNRQAALKCRQRKKQWLADLQTKVEYLANDNENLQNQATSLREEIINIKTLLLAHKDCAVAQANGVVGLDQLRAAPGMLLRQQMPQSASMNTLGNNGSPFQQATQFRSKEVGARGY